VRQAPSVALAASADTPQGNKDQHVVFVAAPPPRRKRFSLNIFSFLKSKTQPDSAPDLSTIMCCHCHATGLHFSHDCPLSCEVCGERGHKDPLECTPQCTACGGGGKSCADLQVMTLYQLSGCCMLSWRVSTRPWDCRYPYSLVCKLRDTNFFIHVVCRRGLMSVLLRTCACSKT
jgi:hypothetical protein